MSANTPQAEATPPTTTTSTGFATPSRASVASTTSSSTTSPSKHNSTTATKTTPPQQQQQQQQRHSLSSPTALPPKLSPFRHGRLLARTSPRSASNPTTTMHSTPTPTTPMSTATASYNRRPSTVTLADEARKSLETQAKELQVGLLELVEQIEASRGEWERLEEGNGFLQSYIGELMQTSRVAQQGGRKKR